jgi:hypothetical protein
MLRGAIDVHRARGHVDEALDEIDCLRPTRAAIGPERSGVGEHHFDADVDRRNGVDARQAVLRVHGREDGGKGRGVGTDPDIGAHAQAEKLAAFVKRKLTLEHTVAAVGVGEKALQPRRTPLHRSRDPSCRKHQRGVVGIGLDLHAESAADVIGEDADLVRRDIEYTLGQHLAYDRDALSRRDERVALRLRVETCNGGARLHRARSETGIHQPHSWDVGGASECGIDRRRVAVLPVECDVARHIGPDRGCAGRHGALHVGNR